MNSNAGAPLPTPPGARSTLTPSPLPVRPSSRGAGSPDVFARGAQVWSKGMGVAAAAFAVKWLRERVPGLRVVVDPFVGEGTTLAVANHFGLDALGIDTSVKKLRKAQRLQGAWLFEADGITPVSEFRQMCWLGDDNNAGDIPGGEASPQPDNG